MRFQNTEKGFQELEAWLDTKRKKDLSLHVTMEATRVYYERLAYYLIKSMIFWSKFNEVIRFCVLL
ncbi:MAG: hypothetical protein LBG80_08145 [Bacteroidales bacterium]|nr:hypothetical protein [Bacteroidales bacterium]